jgi:hypothetical protein
MPADFCLRLALGLVACLLVLSPAPTARPAAGAAPFAQPAFFRTQFLVVLALSCGTLLWVRETASWPLLTLLAGVMVLSFAGSITWSLDRSPGAVTLIILTTAALAVAVPMHEQTDDKAPALAANLIGAGSSALLLGAATSAMLIGHSYLIAPSMSLTPLYRLLGVLAATLAIRAAVESVALGRWTAEHSLANLTGDLMLWLPVRWVVGLAAPAVLCWMAWQTARIRSTQSATGILYVVVIFCFLGELTGRLLRQEGLTL